MNVLPVISREMRAASRHAFTYYLRVLSAGALLLVCFWFGLEHGFRPNRAGVLFGNLHLVLFCAIWILVPILTADCISRERREGTLGLLFLTGLRATDIVAAKGLAHGLRAATMGLAVVPVLAIPVLLGGVGWPQIVLSVAINFTGISLALASGLLASAWSKTWAGSLIWAEALSLFFLLVLSAGVGWLVSIPVTRGSAARGLFNYDYDLVMGAGFLASVVGRPSNFTRLVSSGQMFWAIGKAIGFVLVFQVLVLIAAGRRIRTVWQEEPPSPLQVWWQQRFCTPVVWRGFFRRWLRRTLERNPMGWLERRTWTGRLVTSAWFAVVISLYSAALTEPAFFRGMDKGGLEKIICWFLAGSIAVTAAGSFRRERETGVMELLLVSSLGESEIIFGRLRGLWMQFLPAAVALLGVWLYLTRIFAGNGDVGTISFCATTFATLPVAGLYFSLRCRGFMAAFLFTLGAGLFLPMVLAGWWANLDFLSSGAVDPTWWAAGIQIIFASLFWRALRGRLRRRAFLHLRA